MQKEQIFSAATVDRAIEKALAELQMDRDAVSVEVIEMGRKGFLGIGASDAKIRVTYEAADEIKPAVKAEEKPAPKAEKAEVKTEAKPRPAQNETPRLVKAAPQSADNQKPVQRPAARPAQDEEKPRLVRRASGEKAEAAKPAEHKKPHREPVEETVFVKPDPKPESEWSAEAKAAVQFIDGLLVKLGVEGHAFITAQSEDDHLRIEIEGPDMGPVIGRRGDTLDAIQYLTSLVLNRGTEDHIRLTIDTENYRGKRAESLERLARKMAGKVARYHKPMTLEPMNPYERRIIHSALQDYRGVTTHSTGTEPNRRVVISPEGGRRYAGKRSQRPQQ